MELSFLHMKLRYHEQLNGQLTTEQALNEAIYYSGLREACGPFDPAFSHFTQLMWSHLNHAEVLEQIANHTSKAGQK